MVNVVFQQFVSVQVPITAPGEVILFRAEDVIASHHTAANDDTWEGNVICGSGVMWLTSYQLIWRNIEKDDVCYNTHLPARTTAANTQWIRHLVDIFSVLIWAAKIGLEN